MYNIYVYIIIIIIGQWAVYPYSDQLSDWVVWMMYYQVISREWVKKGKFEKLLMSMTLERVPKNDGAL